MAANTPGVPGALFDPEPTNKLGSLNTGIGWGTNAVFGPPLTRGMDAGDKVGVPRIGIPAPPYTPAQAVGFDGAPVALVVATTTVAPGGAMPDGSTNKTGQTVLPGSGVLGVTLAPFVSDPDAPAGINQAYVNGGTISTATANAANAFVISAKAKGYWTKLARINLFAGDQLASALVPLKPGAGYAVDDSVNFVAGDYSEATGITGNGSS